MEIEEEKREVLKDQAILISPMQRHRIKSIGDCDLRFLCICTPPYSDRDTVLE
ncbi:hypothetical protein [Candidatus Methanoliparum sp. LAM-1]|nr:hypothetical protein [Candidatus Methanoliparum sp. LAM-1]